MAKALQVKKDTQKTRVFMAGGIRLMQEDWMNSTASGRKRMVKH